MRLTLQMNKAKLSIGDIEVQIPVRNEIFGAVSENSHKLGKLRADIVYLLEQMYPPAKQTLTLQVGDAELEFEIEKNLALSIAESYKAAPNIQPAEQAEFEDILRNIVPSNKRPPSSRQYQYMQQIATTLGLEIPEKALIDTDYCSEFIDEHVDEFKQIQSANQAVVREANRVARWVVAYQLNDKGINLTEIAKFLGVVQEKTVQKYLNSLEEWKEDFLNFERSKQLMMNDLINYIIENDYDNVKELNILEVWS